MIPATRNSLEINAVVETLHDSAEHDELGETGSTLAAMVWDQEDFSDWENDFDTVRTQKLR